jgi:copper chaperone CopZ
MHSSMMKLRAQALLLCAGVVLGSAANAGGLLKVKQAVSGVDCAPCAHGVEKGLERIEGVKDATVSLDEGYATVLLAPDNSVTLEKIRQIIQDNGFTLKDATVVVSGAIARGIYNQPLLTTGDGQEYVLVTTLNRESVQQELSALPDGAAVEVKAHLDEDETIVLSVLAVQPEDGPSGYK